MNAPTQRPIDFAHYLPWTRLLRSFRIATDPRKLILAAVAVTLFWCGDRAIRLLPFAPEPSTAVAPPWNAVRPAVLVNWNGRLETPYDAPHEEILSLKSRILAPLQPLLSIAGLPFRPERPWTHLAYVCTRLFWACAVWAFFGGAIARLAAVEFARDERPGILDALKFSARRFVSLFSAPLLPLLAVLGIWGACALGGLLGRIPFLGEWIAAVLWGFAAIAALLMVLILAATALGWPLMIAAVATEGSDAFDGFSRSFSYLYGRPWLFVWYAGLAIVLGPLLVAVVDTIAVGVIAAAAQMVGTGMGTAAVAQLHGAVPVYFDSAVAVPDAGDLEPTGPALVTAIWLGALATVAVGFGTSYFWSAATIVYFLLRRADDATHFDDVWLDDEEEQDDLLPLAGIASTDQPVVERSHHPTVNPPAATA